MYSKENYLKNIGFCKCSVSVRVFLVSKLFSLFFRKNVQQKLMVYFHRWFTECTLLFHDFKFISFQSSCFVVMKMVQARTNFKLLLRNNFVFELISIVFALYFEHLTNGENRFNMHEEWIKHARTIRALFVNSTWDFCMPIQNAHSWSDLCCYKTYPIPITFTIFFIPFTFGFEFFPVSIETNQ